MIYRLWCVDGFYHTVSGGRRSSKSGIVYDTDKGDIHWTDYFNPKESARWNTIYDAPLLLEIDIT